MLTTLEAPIDETIDTIDTTAVPAPEARSSPAPVATRPRRKESLIGVCAALGEDFGFNPDWLRAALAVSILINPEITLISYVTAGVAVLASRLLTRRRKVAAAF